MTIAGFEKSLTCGVGAAYETAGWTPLNAAAAATNIAQAATFQRYRMLVDRRGAADRYGGTVAGDNDDIEVLRSFKASIADLGVTELRQLTDDLTRFAAGAPDLFTRPELRRTPRGEVAIYRVRVDIDGARPPIWRRLDLRSDLHLDLVHQVIQAVFGWTDTHLHRFSLGGGPFDNDSQLFLCP